MTQKAEQQADPLMTMIGSAQKAVGSLARYIQAAQALEDYIRKLVAGDCPKAGPFRQGEDDSPLTPEEEAELIELLIQEAREGGNEGTRWLYELIEQGHADYVLGLLQEAGRRAFGWNLPEGFQLVYEPDPEKFNQAGAVDLIEYFDTDSIKASAEAGVYATYDDAYVGLSPCFRSFNDSNGSPLTAIPMPGEAHFQEVQDCLADIVQKTLGNTDVKFGWYTFNYFPGDDDDYSTTDFRQTADLFSTLGEESTHAWQMHTISELRRESGEPGISYSEAIRRANENEYQTKMYLLNLYNAGLLELSIDQKDKLISDICGDRNVAGDIGYADPRDNDSYGLTLSAAPLGWATQGMIDGEDVNLWPTTTDAWSDLCS